VRGREPSRPRSNHSNPVLRVSDSCFFLEEVDWIARLGPVTLGKEPFQRPYRDWRVKLSAPAIGFTRMATNSATHGSKGIRPPRVAISILVAALSEEGDVATRLRVHRAGLHAGEVRFQPVEIHEF
jgi:hypothetical protein